MSLSPQHYSYVVTWTYFGVYVIIFLVTSIVCAMRVRSDYKQYQQIPQSHKQPIVLTKVDFVKLWGKLLWKKKKVYFQLVPHLFDQASDFGVLVEYWYLRNQNIGINTLYLFAVSVSIIIFHRIISSIAIYRLTNNKLYTICQLFDLLMVQCVWTNYQLDTDEPSNCQRYLQVLEAIFESSPQILISVVFLIKSTTSEISTVVIISLISSFWTLTARVASDDKTMFGDVWKSPTVNKCINGLWFVRVVMWRFLEISTRIILLTLVWITMGGMSIFIILGIECIYLIIVSYGLGTVDMMGNVMYLVAANSSRKNESWAMSMTYIFWSYRVISSYILLIMVTIFANINFEAPKIEDYENRHQQTIENVTGFCLFIFCWIATPIWQWVGAIIVFDLENLSSVGRDIEQLSEQNNWQDVLELIKFGATFSSENTLKRLCNCYYHISIPFTGTIFVKRLHGKILKLRVDSNDTVEHLQHQITEETSIMSENQQLVYQGKWMINTRKLLCDYNIEKESTINLFERRSNKKCFCGINSSGIPQRDIDDKVSEDLFDAISEICLNDMNERNIIDKYFFLQAVKDNDLSTVQWLLIQFELKNIDISLHDSTVQNTAMLYAKNCDDKGRKMIYLLRNTNTYLSIRTDTSNNDDLLLDGILSDVLEMKSLDPVLMQSEPNFSTLENMNVAEDNKTQKNINSNANVVTWQKNTRGLSVSFAFLMCVICIFITAVYSSPDIAMIYIHKMNDCNNNVTPYGGDRFIFSVGQWILSGSILHITFPIIVELLIILEFFVSPAIKCTLISTETIAGLFYLWICLFYCFAIAWSVIGFIMYSDMDLGPEYSSFHCRNIVLAWSILKLLEMPTAFIIICCCTLIPIS
eukprot:227582_1